MFANLRENEGNNDFPGVSGDFADMFKNFGWLLGNNSSSPAAPPDNTTNSPALDINNQLTLFKNHSNDFAFDPVQKRVKENPPNEDMFQNNLFQSNPSLKFEYPQKEDSEYLQGPQSLLNSEPPLSQAEFENPIIMPNNCNFLKDWSVTEAL